jgi:hypothetical protein
MKTQMMTSMIGRNWGLNRSVTGDGWVSFHGMIKMEMWLGQEIEKNLLLMAFGWMALWWKGSRSR